MACVQAFAMFVIIRSYLHVAGRHSDVIIGVVAVIRPRVNGA